MIIKNGIDMDATNEIFRRMDALEKRVKDLERGVNALKNPPKPAPKTSATAKKTTSKTSKK